MYLRKWLSFMIEFGNLGDFYFLLYAIFLFCVFSTKNVYYLHNQKNI